MGSIIHFGEERVETTSLEEFSRGEIVRKYPDYYFVNNAK
jgi:hypothetical protein